MQNIYERKSSISEITCNNNDDGFDKYSKDIKEVRSLVNLWRDEYTRRVDFGIQQD